MTSNFKLKGVGMKKSVLFAALTIMLIMVTSVAFAGTSSGYSAWTTTGANSGSLPTPHKDYQLGTVKCAVCHAVHKGNAGGQLLLRDSVGNACLFCHVQNAIGNIKIYGGNTDNYNTLDFATAHNNDANVSCTVCHAVHGANTVNAPNSVSVKILRNPASPFAYEATATAALGGFTGATPHDSAITQWCTRCHPYFQQASSGDIAVDTDWDGSADTVYQSHVMTSVVSAETSLGGATFNGKVAWKQSLYCRDCHDAGGTGESQSLPLGNSTSNNFPHYTQGAARFLLASSSFATASAGTSAGVGGTEADAEEDGACLKCHKGDQTNGVGIDY